MRVHVTAHGQSVHGGRHRLRARSNASVRARSVKLLQARGAKWMRCRARLPARSVTVGWLENAAKSGNVKKKKTKVKNICVYVDAA